ncbi:50S ribosomal protein L5 [Candidatus Parcubacteria bacterium]|nr:50S ribosomal protein L5 [Candidatus Parcubacteria bacterium]MCK5490405.1 50S ribosomal protein L5 [Candidatus Paceibacterota bacterium]
MYKVRLKEKYISEVVPKMKEEFGYTNIMSVPKITKIVVNVGLGRIIRDSKDNLKKISNDIENIVGQKPVVTKAKKAISNFKTRIGMPVGLTVTLRGAKMYEFLDRLANVTLPQVRDFRGLSKKSFDGNGNYNIGLKEHLIFPEVAKDDIKTIFGLEININTSAQTDKEAYSLLKNIGLPIVEKNNR